MQIKKLILENKIGLVLFERLTLNFRRIITSKNESFAIVNRKVQTCSIFEGY